MPPASSRVQYIAGGEVEVRLSLVFVFRYGGMGVSVQREPEDL